MMRAGYVSLLERFLTLFGLCFTGYFFGNSHAQKI